ncbi:MAG: ABC transporter ATP-binding protein [Desulfobacteria bacterium]
MLRINALKVAYGGVDAIQSISLEIGHRAIVGILGANGAGKSTLIRTISGLKKATTGEIWLDSKRIDDLSPQEIFKMGIATVPEGRRLFPRMSVYENLMMGTCLRNDRKGIKADIEKVYDYFPILKKRWNQKVGTLSGGEQQMAAIGRALMADSKLIILDEPSIGLSPLLVQEMLKILADICNDGKSIVIAEQNATETLKYVQQAYILELGRIALHGSAEEVSNNSMVKATYLGYE